MTLPSNEIRGPSHARSQTLNRVQFLTELRRKPRIESNLPVSCPINNLAFAAGQLAVFSRRERRAYLN
jgi:hypothetical protein